VRAAGETIWAEESLMGQHGWLDLANGVWPLVLEYDDHLVRYWKDRDSALALRRIDPAGRGNGELENFESADFDWDPGMRPHPGRVSDHPPHRQ
jgi:hypothetical protein